MQWTVILWDAAYYIGIWAIVIYQNERNFTIRIEISLIFNVRCIPMKYFVVQLVIWIPLCVLRCHLCIQTPSRYRDNNMLSRYQDNFWIQIWYLDRIKVFWIAPCYFHDELVLRPPYLVTLCFQNTIGNNNMVLKYQLGIWIVYVCLW